MDLSLSAEQKAFVAASRRLLQEVCPPEVVRTAATPAGPGHSAQVWRAIADAGWLGVCFPADLGGAGGSLFDLGLAYREAGRALVPTTLYSTITAGLLIAHIGTVEQQERWLRPLCFGDLIGTIAFSEPAVFEEFELLTTTARPSNGGWVLDGTKAFVANAALADVVLVLARVAGGGNDPIIGLFAVPRNAPGLRLDPYRTFGQDAQFEAALTNCVLAADALLGGRDALGDWRAGCGRALIQARALACMEVVGGIEAVVEQTVSYVGQRQQFGAAIGSFQAVQHQLADVAMRLEAGRIAAFRALSAASDDNVDAERAVIVAELWLSPTYVQATLTAHQVWGGMGYALESDLHLWSQRAKALDVIGGRAATKLERLLTVELSDQHR